MYTALMKQRLPSLSALRVFESAARTQSFKDTANELSVTPTAVSHQIRILETDLDCRLFLRKTRAVALTSEGQLLYDAVRIGFDAIAAGVEKLRSKARPTVTLSTTPAFATKWLVPRLEKFQIAHPHIDLHVHASNQPVALRSGVVDLAVRYGFGHHAGLTSTLLLRDYFAPVASPRLKIDRLEKIAQHQLIHFDWHAQPPSSLTWAGWAVQMGWKDLDTYSGIRFSEESHAIQAAVAGQGVAYLSLVLVREEIHMKLLEVIANPVSEGLAYHLIRPEHDASSEAAKTVERWLLEMAALDALHPTLKWLSLENNP